MGAIRALCQIVRPAKQIAVHVRDIVFEVPGRGGEVADVLSFHDGKLVLRNCHIRGAVAFELHQPEGVMIIRGLAGSVIRYEPPEGVQQ